MKVSEAISITDKLFELYKKKIEVNIPLFLSKIKEIPLTKESFQFYTAVSSMASSKIEGEILDIDSYLKHKLNGVIYQKNLVEKPNDVFASYTFAQNSPLTVANLLKAHKIITKNLLTDSSQGKVRTSDMIIRDVAKGIVIYEACAKEEVKSEFDAFCNFLEELIKRTLSVQETFFYASLLHLFLVKIHPFDDGNGRTARLLEKWFLAEKIGKNAWFIPSEIIYWEQRETYYKNIALLGFFYEKLNYNNSIPFLLMLPNFLKNTTQ
jgi:filamentation induced by cAMP protein fic